MRLVSLASGIFWVAAALGSIAALAMLSEGPSPQSTSRADSTPQSRSRSAAESDPSRMSKLAAMFGGTASGEGRDAVRKDRGCRGGECSVGGLGRQWAKLRDYNDAADCDGASSSIDFENGCRAYAEEHAKGGKAIAAH